MPTAALATVGPTILFIDRWCRLAAKKNCGVRSTFKVCGRFLCIGQPPLMASGKKSDPPIKGILKSTSNFKKEKSQERRGSREMKWDEVNIKATFHPADKTYGHQKVDEPPTPYHFTDDSDPRKQPMSPTELASRLKDVKIKEQEKDRIGSFEDHRKAHYNEYQAVKLARHLLEQEERHQEEKKK